MAKTEGVDDLVGMFFSQDVQGDVNDCDELLMITDQIRSGELDEWGGIGNAHSLEIRQDGVTIECVWDDTEKPVTIPIETFRQCIVEWKASIVRLASNR